MLTNFSYIILKKKYDYLIINKNILIKNGNNKSTKYTNRK